MLTIAILATSLNFLITPLSTLLPYFVKFDHLGGAAELALVMAFFEGGILGGGLFMSLKKGFEKKIAISIVSIIIAFSGYALIALTPSGMFRFMALSALVFAVCLPVANVLLQTIMQTAVPLDMQGRVNSVTMALSMAAQPAGTLISGAIVQFTMTYQLFLGCSVVGIAIAVASWFLTDIRYLGDDCCAGRAHVSAHQHASAVIIRTPGKKSELPGVPHVRQTDCTNNGLGGIFVGVRERALQETTEKHGKR